MKSTLLKSFIFIILVLLITTSGFYFYNLNKTSNSANSKDKTEVASSNLEAKRFDFESLEIANNDNERSTGFKYRTDICDKCAILFIFEYPLKVDFWMKDTPSSLDIIFITDNGRVTDVHKNTNPYQVEPKYKSSEKIKYTLEVKAGISQTLDINKGDLIDIKYLINQGKDFQFLSS